jgi:hypothetical protein
VDGLVVMKYMQGGPPAFFVELVHRPIGVLLYPFPDDESDGIVAGQSSRAERLLYPVGGVLDQAVTPKMREAFAFGLPALPQSTETVEEVALRKPIILFAFAAFAFPANAKAQSPELEETCKSVAKSFFMADQLAIGTVQSFPELKPPGVRLSYSTRQGTAPAEMTDIFECEFDKADKPHNLARFCVSSTCYSPNVDDGDRKRRFEEMRILLNRAEK